MAQQTHTPGPMTLIPLGKQIPIEDPIFAEHYFEFRAGKDGVCGAASGMPDITGLCITGVMKESDAQRIKLCWDSHDQLVQALSDGLMALAKLQAASEFWAEGEKSIRRSAMATMRTALDTACAGTEDETPEPSAEKPYIETTEADSDRETFKRESGVPFA